MSIALAAPALQPTMQNLSDHVREFASRLSQFIEDPHNAENRELCQRQRRELARQVALQPKGVKEGESLQSVLKLLGEIAESGLWDYPASPEDAACVDELSTRAWPGLLAAMILVPAFQWPKAPRIEDVPYFLWEAYAAYVFYSPAGFTATGQADGYAQQYLKWLEQVCRLAEANRGSSAVRSLLSVYLAKGNCIPLYFNSFNLRRHYELRARILLMATNAGRQTELPALPREGRRLKVGFLNRHFGPQTETYTTLPSFELLDPERFEVRLFALRQSSTPLETYVSGKAGGITFLPENFDDQLRMLRDEFLDVLVFGTNVTAVFNEVTRLALHRIAPLQVVNNSSCTTSGMSELDLYVSGSYTETQDSAAHYTERLGLLPGPAHAFNYEADAVASQVSLGRKDISVPEDAVLFVSASNYYKIIPEMMDTWAELLSRVPGSYLLLHPFNPNWTNEYPVKRFTSLMEAALARRGVDHSRLIVSTIRFPSRCDVGALLGLGNLYLDSYPFGGVNSIIDPLERGVPVVEWEGDCFRSRMGSAVLRQLGLAELCAGDRESYLDLCVKLAGDPARRSALRESIMKSMQSLPLFFDQLAASDAFGELLTIAYDELLLKGHSEFRRSREPIVASRTEDPETILSTASYLIDIGMGSEAVAQIQGVLASNPAHPEARRRMAQILTAAGRHERAVEYLLAAVQSAQLPSLYWRELCSALRSAGNFEGAKQALDTALRLDPKDPENWFVLGELAWESRHQEFLDDVINMLSQLCPAEPRLQSLVSRRAQLASAS
jgi:predicted O-linked N-acetylglucosamine transferase (SPINDLY family)